MMRTLILRGLLPFVLVSLIAALGITIHARADLAVSEAGLNPDSAAYEINPDAAGKLWVSDFTAGQVWGVDPATGNYSIYDVTGYPSDARQAGGYLWWADGLSDVVGRVSTNDHTYTKWIFPGANAFYGTNLDDSGRFYAVDNIDPVLYRLDPGGAKLCTYTLPGLGASSYIVRDGDYLWFSDGISSLMMRYQISTSSLTVWALPEDSFPFGMAVDGGGNLWYVDKGTYVLAQLNPGSHQLLSFSLPDGNQPEMIAVQSGFIWYTDQSIPSIGRLDPLTASHTTIVLTHSSATLTPTCVDISPSSTGTMSVTTGSLSWVDSTYATYLNDDGWLIFKMPDSSLPWGITIPGLGYAVDTGRQQLVRFSTTLPTSLVVIKHVINDSVGTATADDFTMNVTAVNPSQSSFPGAESPGVEITLDPGSYSVTETGPDGYTASYSAGCAGTIAVGQVKFCTITNDDIGYKIYLPLLKK